MRRLALMAAFGTIVVLVLLSSGGVAGADTLPICAMRGSSPTAVQADLQLVKVNGLQSNGPVKISFDDERDERDFTLEYQVLHCVFPETAVGGTIDVQRRIPVDSDGSLLATRRVTVDASLKTPALALFRFVVEPDRNHASPGTYESGFVVTDKRFTLPQQEVSITLRYQHTLFLFATLLLPTVLFGSLAIWYKGSVGNNGSDNYFKWWMKIGNWAAVLVGLAAARAYFGTKVLGSPDYGRELYHSSILGWISADSWYLVAAGTLSAFIAAALGASLVGDSARGGSDKPVATQE